MICASTHAPQMSDSRRTMRFSLLFTLAAANLLNLLISSCLLAAPNIAIGSNPSGKKIRSIQINLKDIFDNDTGAFYRSANAIKVNTREYVIRQEIIVKEGDDFDEFAVRESERNLRTLRYLRNVTIDEKFDGNFVDLTVNAEDTWTLLPKVNFSSGSGNNSRSFGVAESNLLGFGKRAEVLYSIEDNRTTLEGVWNDPRVWGTKTELLLGYFDRSDGKRSVFEYGLPYRTLVDKNSWSFDIDDSDAIGRLYQFGDERFIFRQERAVYGARYNFAKGDPESHVQRFGIGYNFIEDRFKQADASDFDDLDLDPATVSNDPTMVPENRRFSGPEFDYASIVPDYISMNYIDRFDRVQDYNLGGESHLTMMFAPESLGSVENTLLLDGNRTFGERFGPGSFGRGEFGFSTRRSSSSFDNTLLRGEANYYNVLGVLKYGDMYLGKHTLAAGIYTDWGLDLDRDREFLIGADTGLRGYEARTFTGDKRLVLNLEERAHFADDILELVSVGGAAFIDAGGATVDSYGHLFDEDLYADAGIGLRLGFPRSSGGKVARIDFAVPMRDSGDGNDFTVRILFTGGQIFSSQLRSELLGARGANVEVGADR